MRGGLLLAFCLLFCGGAHAAPPARIEAQSTDLKVVGLLQGDALSIHVSRLLDNAAVRDAVVSVALRGATYPAIAQTDGGYSVVTKDLAVPGAAAMEFHVVAGGTDEKLTGTLAVAGAASNPADSGNARQMFWWVLNFSVCGLFLVMLARRKKSGDA